MRGRDNRSLSAYFLDASRRSLVPLESAAWAQVAATYAVAAALDALKVERDRETERAIIDALR